MSKSTMNRREKILDKALEMFNERGIEYVGLHELAALLDMRVSNITYYFPTKDDLVYELSLQLSESNAGIIVATKGLSMEGFLQMLHHVFQNHIRFRCLLLSVVHLLKQNKHMASAYKKNQGVRNATILANLKELVSGGYLVVEETDEMNFLVSTLSLVSRFWISESEVSNRQWSTQKQILYYLKLITTLLAPYATLKGSREMEKFIASIE
jgi:AcrR family transcriptional regulator